MTGTGKADTESPIVLDKTCQPLDVLIYFLLIPTPQSHSSASGVNAT